MKEWIIYAGSYAPYGLSRFRMNGISGELYNVEQLGDVIDVKYLAQQGEVLALACKKGEDAGVCFIEKEDARKEVLFSKHGENAPCYVGAFEDLLITANYHAGNVFLYRNEQGRFKEEQILEFGAGAGCHQAMVQNELLFVPCLKQDCIRIFDLEKGKLLEQMILFPKGSGPRHGVWNHDGTRMWVVGELDNQLYEVHRSPEHMFEVQKVAEIVTGDRKKGSQSAAIRLSSDGRFLTVSTRGANALTTWSVEKDGLRLIQQISCGGDHPRDFLFTPDEQFLLLANRGTGEVLSFERNKEIGLIGRQIGRVEVKEVISLLIEKEQIL